MNNVLDLVDQIFFRLEQAAGVACSVSGCMTAQSTSTDCADFIATSSRDGYPAASNAHPCRSAALAGYRPAIRPASRSSRRRGRVKISTPGSSEQANTPLDAEHGPGWHLAVLPFTDGGAGVSLLLSHCLTDGIGGCLAVVEAACGYDHAFNWPAAGSRPRWQALRQDARQTVRDIPDIRRAVVAAARFARRNRRRAGSATARPAAPLAPRGGADEHRHAPNGNDLSRCRRVGCPRTVTGGTSNMLLAALAARLAQRVGRVAADGSVTLAIPVNERTAGDTRANAITMSTSRSTLHPRRRTCARSGPQPSKR